MVIYRDSLSCILPQTQISIPRLFWIETVPREVSKAGTLNSFVYCTPLPKSPNTLLLLLSTNVRYVSIKMQLEWMDRVSQGVRLWVLPLCWVVYNMKISVQLSMCGMSQRHQTGICLSWGPIKKVFVPLHSRSAQLVHKSALRNHLVKFSVQ